ncbi:MAG: histidine--tRNA ligase [Candidatus Treponema excrementipullorum]|nr:histidine--tRNA ligase [Spirochaetia bacterium]MCI7590256.1 histidine--tRNA ligase [Spirochaetia bacterium]MDY4465142.1 histidine--tRNA ligase [Candidatus Treponema excrementipullorum]
MESLIQPRILKGFRDFLPEAEITRSTLIEKLTNVFRSFGYVPIDTPVMEYSEILLRKSNGETEKQVFRFEDNGGRDVALRFDLTVPFARFTAEHKDELYFPFKRYHIAKVWRGEKPQAGRYREFIQCDFDCVGSDSASSDFEILSLMKAALQAIGVEDITIRMSHRGIFNQFLEKRNLTDKSEDILRTVDKLAKVGKEEVSSQLESLTGSNTTAEEILEYITPADTFEQTLTHMEAMAGGESENTSRMREIYAMMEAAGIASSFVLDPSITRGLDYYTGIVYETFLNELPGIGSVCSGGRYDNLAGLYMKEKVPGVGSSIGLDRLIAGLQQLNKLESRKSFIDAEIFCLDKDMMTEYHRLAQTLRQRGVRCEVFPDPKKLLAQYTVAEKKGIPFGITLKKEDVAGNTVMIKNLATREVFENISLDKAIDILLRKN